jgi:BASS family bile acid:Na+ symporter
MSLLRNSTLIFALSILLGLVHPGFAQRSQSLITPALMLMMAFSLMEIDLRPRGDLRGALVGFTSNYVLLSGLIVGLSFALEDGPLRQGFVVMAAVPPAIGILPLTRLLDGDVRLSLYAEAICYLASLVLMPAVIYAFSGRTGVNILYLVEISVLLILIPAFVSRWLRRLRLDPVLPINLGFFVVGYTVIGLNSPALSGELSGDLADLSLMAFLRTFGIGTAVFLLAKLQGTPPSRRISYTLFSSYKNLGLAAAVSLVLFGPEAGLPSAVCILAETAFYVILSIAKQKQALG